MEEINYISLTPFQCHLSFIDNWEEEWCRRSDYWVFLSHLTPSYGLWWLVIKSETRKYQLNFSLVSDASYQYLGHTLCPDYLFSIKALLFSITWHRVGGGDVDDGAFSQSEPRLVTNRLKSTNKCLPKFLALKTCQTHGNLISRRSDTILIGHFIDILSVRCLPSSFLNQVRLVPVSPQVTAKPYSIVLAPIFVITQSGSYFTGNICLYLFSFHIHLLIYL